MSALELVFAQTALDDVDQIHSDSTELWGEKTADKYIADIQKIIKGLTLKPQLGKLRSVRSSPFFMVSARQHFIVYHVQKKKIVILAVFHQRRHSEKAIADMKAEFFELIRSLL